MSNKNTSILFIVPHILINTTSVNRYKSIIKALYQEDYQFKIISFKYPGNSKHVLGNEVNEVDPLEDYISQNLYLLRPQLNIIQKCAFFFIEFNSFPFWK